ncbi:hypothetical protein BC833DRAFT_357722 [Globomyces pollinis-pini]|nr:hypothetical protein BC833DRAFT_357722 [Globomyces pollinis-pini]
MPHPIIHILKFTALTVCVAVAVGYVLLQPMQTHEGYTHQNHKEKNNTFEEEEDPLDLVRNLNQPSDFHSLKKSLMEMGFEETLVEKSLKDFNNDLNLLISSSCYQIWKILLVQIVWKVMARMLYLKSHQMTFLKVCLLNRIQILAALQHRIITLYQ